MSMNVGTNYSNYTVNYSKVDNKFQNKVKMEKATRTFGRSELAQQYFPRLTAMSAWRKFKEWLMVNPQLRHLYDLSRRTYTPAEVQLIYSQLGEP